MRLSWAIGSPGRNTIGTLLKFVISSVSVPFNDGSTNPAVACTINPRRPRELLWVVMNDRVTRNAPRGEPTSMHLTGTLDTGRTSRIPRE